jgi:hypothetical protein
MAYTTGVTGLAGEFNGIDSYIEAPHNAAISFTGTEHFTISLWANRTGNSPSGIGNLVTKGMTGDPENYEYSLNFADSTAALPFTDKFYLQCEHTNGTGVQLLSGNTLSGSVWYHFMTVWDGADQSIYIDGVLDSTQTPVSGPGPGASRALRIGLGGMSPFYRFNR